MEKSETDSGEGPGARDFVAEQRALRLAKLERLRDRGIQPYPPGFSRDHTVAEVTAEAGEPGPGTVTGTTVRIAGRLVLIRDHGGVIFATLRDQSGTIQVAFERDRLDRSGFDDAKSLDRGDWIGLEGVVITTRAGELTVSATGFELLTKSLRALPDKHLGLTDVDTRLRQRYLDLIANPGIRPVFDIRSKVIASVRQTLIDGGFTEVETPVLAPQVGGAAARPFITHHNSLNIEMYMRVALELPLKRLVVGGFERVFELSRVFRNEGLDTRHNPEFTLLEAYQALGDYHDMMDLVEKICSNAALDAIGTSVVEVEGQTVDLKPPWRRVTMADLVREVTGETMHPSTPLEEARAICDRLEVHYEPGWGAGRLLAEVCDETCEETLIQPTIVCDYPQEISPLAKVHRDDPGLTERFEVVVAGRELANAYSELNDPVDQRARFEEEAKAKAAGDEEAESVDDDYIRALEYGLPPTGGLGIGVDRLVMLVAEAVSIRDVILFPAMRPEDGATAGPGFPGGALPTAAETALRTMGPAAAEAAAGGGSARAGAAGDGAPGIEAHESGGEAADEAEAPAAPVSVAATPTGSPAARKWLGWLTALAGIVHLISLAPGLDSRLGLGQLLDDVTGQVSSTVIAALLGMFLLVVAGQIGRGKRRAWFVATLLFTIAAAINILKGPHPVVVLYSGLMVIALVWNRDSFGARPDPASLLDAIRFVPVYLAGVFAFGFISLLVERSHVDQNLTFGGMAETTLAGLVGLDGPYTYNGKFFTDFYPAALLALGIAGLALFAILVFRAVALRSAPTGEDREKASDLVHRYGSGTLDYFALRSDKSYFFSADGEAMLAYTYISGFALVSGDPIGRPGSNGRVIDQFIAFCRERNWKTAFLAVREADMDLYSRRGFRSVYLGDEAIIPCDRFTLSGSAMKSVRAAVKRVERQCEFRMMRESDASPELCAQLNEIRKRWRGDAPERGFTMELGRDVKGKNPDFLLAVAFGADRRPLGFLRLVPCFGEDPGWSLDLMQRDPDAPNGMTEYLIANSALTLGQQGFRRLSMNFAAWGRLFDDSARLTLPQKGLRKIASVLNPFFQIESLRNFNAKFDPEWWPRSIVIEEVESAPKVSLLYATSEGFVNIPLVGRNLVPPLRAETGSK